MINDLPIDADGNVIPPTPEEVQAEIERLIVLALCEPVKTREQQVEALSRALAEANTTVLASLFPNTFKFEVHIENWPK